MGLQFGQKDNILIIRGSGFINPDEIRNIIDKLVEKLFETEIFFSILFDMKAVKLININSVKIIAEFMEKYSSLAEQTIKCSVIVVANKIIENMIELLFTWQKPITPIKIVDTVEKACEYLQD